MISWQQDSLVCWGESKGGPGTIFPHMAPMGVVPQPSERMAAPPPTEGKLFLCWTLLLYCYCNAFTNDTKSESFCSRSDLQKCLRYDTVDRYAGQGYDHYGVRDTGRWEFPRDKRRGAPWVNLSHKHTSMKTWGSITGTHKITNKVVDIYNRRILTDRYTVAQDRRILETAS